MYTIRLCIWLCQTSSGPFQNSFINANDHAWAEMERDLDALFRKELQLEGREGKWEGKKEEKGENRMTAERIYLHGTWTCPSIFTSTLPPLSIQPEKFTAWAFLAHYTDEETKARRDEEPLPRPHAGSGARLTGRGWPGSEP